MWLKKAERMWRGITVILRELLQSTELMILFCAWQLVVAGLYRYQVSASFLFEKRLAFYYGETCSVLRTSTLCLCCAIARHARHSAAEGKASWLPVWRFLSHINSDLWCCVPRDLYKIRSDLGKLISLASVWPRCTPMAWGLNVPTQPCATAQKLAFISVMYYLLVKWLLVE